jgi:hypothetical protein
MHATLETGDRRLSAFRRRGQRIAGRRPNARLTPPSSSARSGGAKVVIASEAKQSRSRRYDPLDRRVASLLAMTIPAKSNLLWDRPARN